MEDKIKQDPRNARTHSKENKKAIRRSLDELGAGRSIVVDKDGVAIGGNAVLEKATELGLDMEFVHTKGDRLVVVVRDDLATDDPRRKALALADNQIATMAEWDEPLLEELKLEIQDLGDIDLDVMGFDLPIEPIEEPTEPGELIDRAEELQKKWRVERGQIWEIEGKAGKHRVMCGDSTDEGNVALLLDGAEPYLMVTDPPYGVEYDPKWRNEAAAKGQLAYAARRIGEVANDDHMDWGIVYSFWPCKVLYCWHAGMMAAPVQIGIESAGFELRSQIIWSKPHFPISRGAYTWQHEPCWYAVRKGAKAQWIGDHNASTVWPITLDANVEGGHSTQKPVECMARPIRNHEGNVADPFLGSGTTVVAAEQEGRICYGMEIAEKYVSVTLERLSVLGLEPRLMKE